MTMCRICRKDTGAAKRTVSDRASNPLKWVVAASICLLTLAAASPVLSSGEKRKVLHVMSYHIPWEWTTDQFAGFQDALKGVDVEYRVFEMDTKRHSSDRWKEQKGREARELIATWKPDLVYTTDDNAQQYVATHFINRGIPLVFSGVNKAPGAYGFEGSSNITGVLEQEHFIATMNLLREIVPRVRTLAVIVDDDPTWEGVIERMKQQAHQHLADIRFEHWDRLATFQAYREKILAYQQQVDALGLLGIHTLKDEDGRNVPWQAVLQWTAENSSLPDFSFWKDRSLYGTLCGVYVSGYQQGLAAGEIARGILAGGKRPSNYPMEPTRKGQPVLSLARARKLGIPVQTTVLLTAQIIQEFAWEKER